MTDLSKLFTTTLLTGVLGFSVPASQDLLLDWVIAPAEAHCVEGTAHSPSRDHKHCQDDAPENLQPDPIVYSYKVAVGHPDTCVVDENPGNKDDQRVDPDVAKCKAGEVSGDCPPFARLIDWSTKAGSSLCFFVG